MFDVDEMYQNYMNDIFNRVEKKRGYPLTDLEKIRVDRALGQPHKEWLEKMKNDSNDFWAFVEEFTKDKA